MSAAWIPLLSFLALIASPVRAQENSGEHQRLADLRGVWQANFNQDATRIVVRLRNGETGLWDVEKGTPVAGDLSTQAPSDACVMTNDGRMVLIGSKQNARVFDTTSGAALSPALEVHLRPDSGPQAFFSPHGQTLVTCEAKEASIWQIRNGEKIAKIPLPGGPDDDSAETMPSALFTKDGAHCFLHDGRGTVVHLDTKTWQPVGKPMKHPPAPSAYDFYFEVSEDGKWLATSDSPGENGPKANLQLWDVTANKPLGPPIVSTNGFGVSFVPGANRVVIAPARGEATVRELPSLKVVFNLRPHDDLDGPAFDVSPDGKWLVSWGPDHWINLYETATGKLAQVNHTDAKVSTLTMSPDSRACYVVFDNSAFFTEGYHDNYIIKLALPELKITGLHRVLDYVASANISPDGRRLVIVEGETDKEHISLLETATMKVLGSAAEK